MQNKKSVLGIDIGSITVSVVELDDKFNVINTAYAFHEGKPEKILMQLLDQHFTLPIISNIAATSSTPDILKFAKIYDSRVSYITAAKQLYPQLGSLLIIGGEKFGLALFNDEGEYMNYRSNTSCAAGTGSFLDQQAKRLNLGGIEEFCELSYGNQGNIPKIASRCSVFAKTDLIHAQQEGYSLEEICDGLCFGLARNVADTLFHISNIKGPMVFSGGVSKNNAVLKHLSTMTDINIITDEFSHLYGAIGAAINLLQSNINEEVQFNSSEDVILFNEKEKVYYSDPLEMKQSEYPDFKNLVSFEFSSTRFPNATPVEVDIYSVIEKDKQYETIIGIDIGSTSTKAVLMDKNRSILAGFYTRTSGRPVIASQTIFECIFTLFKDRGADISFLNAGTTGSGRKFIAEIIGADMVLDEITAHARAAYELNPEVDTIIEIGGQDSKFTTMKNGMVTFSIMNNVCAAGTGSFIEEQAKKLGCPLSEYSDRSIGKPAPLSSDRCTVFMERDLNHYMNEGYSVDEILASVLHSVRDNYLTKVAIEKNIGDHVYFQGATAKNKALVAAFEQKLNKPIMVSKYCHLTGALGVSLALLDEGISESKFRGLDIYKADIPVKSEVCDLCTNHCKIRIADVNGDIAAFGFLCGRDYETKKYVRNDNLFDLIKTREKLFSIGKVDKIKNEIVVGIPAALHLFEDLPLWQKFFQNLKIKTITSKKYDEAVKVGKKIAGAEFCAPVTALYGHVSHLEDNADYIFMPVYIEEQKINKSYTRNYCYYTQYGPSIVSMGVSKSIEDIILSPVVRSTMGAFYLKIQLFKMLKQIKNYRASFMEVSRAFDDAVNFITNKKEEMKQIYKDETANSEDISVVFVGRPYTVLSPTMNSGIPDIFAKNGVKAFFQDMITPDERVRATIDPLLKNLHWKFAATIMETAEAVANKKGVYPVFVTSFKCTPDSYAVEYFKQAMDKYKKPFLILQLDEHDSSVGYETRIESGIRAFRNHMKTVVAGDTSNENITMDNIRCSKDEINGKTLLSPNWDPITCKLLEATLKNHGFDARMVNESASSIQRSMLMNTGQCIPLNVMLQNAIDYILENDLEPSNTVMWTGNSQLSCNIGMFPAYKKNLLHAYGMGMENVSIYSGDPLFFDISFKTGVNAYLSYMFGGMLRRLGCRFRPYEIDKGATDAAIEKSMEIFYNAFLNDESKEKAVDQVLALFETIEVEIEERPKVAIFGDMYVRDNDIMNQDLIRLIEENGGEVVTTPYSEFVKIVANLYIKKWFKIGKYKQAIISKLLQQIIPIVTRKYEKKFQRILPKSKVKTKDSLNEALELFNLKFFHTGESMENILKIMHLREAHPDLALLVQTNPSYCCPSLVTEAMSERIEDVAGVPIVTIEYDGTGGVKNEDIIPYLHYL